MGTLDIKFGKKDRTRDKLLTAAQSLILEEGVAPLSLNDFTERAELAPGTFYNYFKSKKELVEAVVQLLLLAYHNIIDQISAEYTDPAMIFSSSFRQTLFLSARGDEYGRLLFDCGLPLQLYTAGIRVRAVQDLQQCIAVGRFKIKNMKVIMSLITGGVIGVSSDLYRGELTINDIDDVCVTNMQLLGLSEIEANDLGRRVVNYINPPRLPLSYLDTLAASHSGQ